ncbi:MAG: histidine kinase [Cyclobacteriaceae bacterium]|nr:histidine kinase [Cyclobacteriaceae bacterium]
MKISKKQATNGVIHILLWVAVFLFPFLFKPQDVTFSTHQLIGIYLNLIFTLIVFYVSYSLIIPVFFYRKKIALTILLVIVASFAGSLMLGKAKETVHAHYFQNTSLPPFQELRGRRMMANRSLFHPQRPFFDAFFFYLLVSGAALSIRATQKWIHEEHDRKALEADKASLELAWLKNQVSPHFFFNTLNNIYSLIESNPEFAQQAVHMLSKLMRYLLYESNAPAISLSKEVVFIENYIGLMKLKLSDKVLVKFEHPNVSESVNVPPLLFNPLIENAFKYGVSYEQESFIIISLEVINDHVLFSIENSLITGEPQKEHSGIGLKNLEHRLNLLYHNSYSLKVHKTFDKFAVKLEVPLYED